MDAVLRATAIYLALMVLFKIAGRRSLADVTTFDLVLLMIIGEATQQGLLGDDFSVTNALLVIITLITIDVGLSLLKRSSPRLARILDGSATILVEHGRPLPARMKEARVDKEDILMTARLGQGIDSMANIKYAILETTGKISIIPYGDDESPA